MSSMLKIVDKDGVFIGTLLVPETVKKCLRLNGFCQMSISASVPMYADYVFDKKVPAPNDVLFRDKPSSAMPGMCATVEGMSIAELEREDGFAFIPKSAAGGR